ncbi:ATPase-stabilizing factor 15 kDa protein [Aspergillus tubingensis]|uniref:ATPase-stabilizing factor 15 kDa protein n=1 Tax=Aspergillus tubingensis TaxID=5068 RepID=UPI001578B65F|nr:ATPase-stabilizing factor 15 kDa protein [Aspergillus tubingensis]GFN12754.1 ATPase-stabilizing factor 15 kDa protein [Aspergillus tubingensis]
MPNYNIFSLKQANLLYRASFLDHKNAEMTRSHKTNDPDHSALHEGGALGQESLPRYFAKSGPVDADPRKTKKDGGGKRNWGRSGDEVHDYGYKFTNTRRHSNSSAQGIADFKTKFEAVEPEPVFEETVHGPDAFPADDDMVRKVDSINSDTTEGSEVPSNKP